MAGAGAGRHCPTRPKASKRGRAAGPTRPTVRSWHERRAQRHHRGVVLVHRRPAWREVQEAKPPSRPPVGVRKTSRARRRPRAAPTARVDAQAARFRVCRSAPSLRTARRGGRGAVLPAGARGPLLTGSAAAAAAVAHLSWRLLGGRRGAGLQRRRDQRRVRRRRRRPRRAVLAVTGCPAAVLAQQGQHGRLHDLLACYLAQPALHLRGTEREHAV